MNSLIKSCSSFRPDLLLLLSVVVAVFIFQNKPVVEIRSLFWTVPTSRALLILTALAIGMILSWLLHGYLHMRRRK